MVVGSALRRNNRKIVEKVLRRIFDNEKYYDVLPPERLNKIIDWTVKVGRFLLQIAFFIALSTIFVGILYPKLGFEKTVIVLMTVIIFILRSFLESLKGDDSPLRKKF